MRLYEWILIHWPISWRRRIAVVVVVAVFLLAALPPIVRAAGQALDLGILPYMALWILCWVGEGGLLVPIPGVRLLSWLTIVQLGASLEPAFVALVAAAAMACGQSSYFLVVRSGSRLVEEHLAIGPLRGRLPIPVPESLEADPASSGPGTDGVAGPTGGMPSEGETGPDRHGRLAHAGSAISQRLRAHPRRTIFVVSTVPSPLTTLTTVGASTSGIPFSTFFVAALAGFLILASVLAFAGQAIIATLGV